MSPDPAVVVPLTSIDSWHQSNSRYAHPLPQLAWEICLLRSFRYSHCCCPNWKCRIGYLFWLFLQSYLWVNQFLVFDHGYCSCCCYELDCYCCWYSIFCCFAWVRVPPAVCVEMLSCRHVYPRVRGLIRHIPSLWCIHSSPQLVILHQTISKNPYNKTKRKQTQDKSENKDGYQLVMNVVRYHFAAPTGSSAMFGRPMDKFPSVTCLYNQKSCIISKFVNVVIGLSTIFDKASWNCSVGKGALSGTLARSAFNVSRSILSFLDNWSASNGGGCGETMWCLFESLQRYGRKERNICEIEIDVSWWEHHRSRK